MPTSREKGAEEPSAAGSAPAAAGRNGYATTSLAGGLLGVTGIGVLLGLGFGVLGLVRARRRPAGGRFRCWTGIVASLLWAGLLVYLVPDIIKAADPGCTAFKGAALASYNRAVEDFRARATDARTTTDLQHAISGIRAAADRSKDAASRRALRQLSQRLGQILADTARGPVPGSVFQALNHDAGVADSACGTL